MLCAPQAEFGQEQPVTANESGRSTFDMSCVTRLAGARQLDGRVGPHAYTARPYLEYCVAQRE